MTILFHPQDDELHSANLDEKLEIFLVSAEKYKTIVLDAAIKYGGTTAVSKSGAVPRDITTAYNWDGLSGLLRQIRELPESSPSARLSKSMKLQKLAEIYEVLRDGRMPKLEAVRIALVNEATQLKAQ